MAQEFGHQGGTQKKGGSRRGSLPDYRKVKTRRHFWISWRLEMVYNNNYKLDYRRVEYGKEKFEIMEENALRCKYWILNKTIRIFKIPKDIIPKKILILVNGIPEVQSGEPATGWFFYQDIRRLAKWTKKKDLKSIFNLLFILWLSF